MSVLWDGHFCLASPSNFSERISLKEKESLIAGYVWYTLCRLQETLEASVSDPGPSRLGLKTVLCSICVVTSWLFVCLFVCWVACVCWNQSRSNIWAVNPSPVQVKWQERLSQSQLFIIACLMTTTCVHRWPRIPILRQKIQAQQKSNIPVAEKQIRWWLTTHAFCS